MTGARYTYGDSGVAAERLALVAEIFEPTTTALVRDLVDAPPPLAIDLGCGPGLTTRLLRRLTGAGRTVGLDRSESFLAMARMDAPDGVEFLVHDARELPWPTGHADLAYCRLLLPHLVEPGRVVAGWFTQLRPGGLLLLDELETVETDEPAFVNYLDQVARAVVARQGADLYVGPVLHAMDDPAGGVRLVDRLATFRPDAALTARIFGMNLRVLTEAGEIDPRPDIAAGLDAIVRTGRGQPATWWVRQLGFRSGTGLD
jgi:SAM-dependent methyltransferase